MEQTYGGMWLIAPTTPRLAYQGDDSDGSAGTMPTQRQGKTTNPIRTSLGQLPLAGKSVLIIEDKALVAMSVESCLQDAGAAVVIANSIALAQSALDEGIPFDAAVVDLHLADGNASPLIQVLSERGIPVVVTTGAEVDRRQPALSKAVAILQKPHADSDLVNTVARFGQLNALRGGRRW
jgi:DNA-binding NtrC family response regulator